MKGATPAASEHTPEYRISIHAPNEGSDKLLYSEKSHKRFQSTLPMKGATRSFRYNVVNIIISIHAPNEGSD